MANWRRVLKKANPAKSNDMTETTDPLPDIAGDGANISPLAAFRIEDGMVGIWNVGKCQPVDNHRAFGDHDILALASGLYRPEAITIDDARIGTHETPAGVALDADFDLETGDGMGAFPALRIRGATVLDGWDPEGNVVQFKQITARLGDLE